MRAYDLIYQKKTGGELAADQIRWWVEQVTRGEIPLEQSAALLMAICWQGMSTAETLALTLAMRDSGTRMDLSSVPGIKVDKHSTGGVGDKTTLIVGPIVAACGVPCAMFSGRGLGHTGGTVDKLSAIPGLRVELSPDAFARSLRETGFANSAQTATIAPADRKLYALRDVTATVESIPLITASIMSKKLAGGADALVLDVKCGASAFMKSQAEAEALANSLVAVGQAHGLRVKALITRMEEPLGWAIGNALEVMEAVEILRGEHADSTLAQLSLRLAAEMILLGEGAVDLDEAQAKASEALASGRAFEAMKAFVALNGGDAEALEDFSKLPQGSGEVVVSVNCDGFVTAIDGRALGVMAMELGAGRQTPLDPLNLGVGLRLHVQVGQQVKKGDPLVTLVTGAQTPPHQEQVLAAFSISPQGRAESPWLLSIVK